MAEKIMIEGEYITLGQMLKFINYIASGGEARFFLTTYTVKVNGEKETRRGRKLFRGDEVAIFDKLYQID